MSVSLDSQQCLDLEVFPGAEGSEDDQKKLVVMLDRRGMGSFELKGCFIGEAEGLGKIPSEQRLDGHLNSSRPLCTAVDPP